MVGRSGSPTSPPENRCAKNIIGRKKYATNQTPFPEDADRFNALFIYLFW